MNLSDEINFSTDENNSSNPLKIMTPSKQVPIKARHGLADITNVQNQSFKVNSTSKSMNLALLVKKSGVRPAAYISVTTPKSDLTTPKSDLTTPSIKSFRKSSLLCSPYVSSPFMNEMGGSCVLPLDDFASVGVNPLRFRRMGAARDIVIESGLLHTSRVCSPLVLTDDMQCRLFNNRKPAPTKATEVEVSSPSPPRSSLNPICATPAPHVSEQAESDVEWYHSPEPNAELESVRSRLTTLQRDNATLEKQLADARKTADKVDEVGNINARISEVAQQLKGEVDTKEAEIRQMKIVLEKNGQDLELLRQTVQTMETMNGALNDELSNAHEMMNDIREDPSKFSSPATCRSEIISSVDSAEHERERMQLDMQQEGNSNMKQQLEAMQEQIDMQAELLKKGQEDVTRLEHEKNMLVNSAGREYVKQLRELQVQLQTKSEALQLTEQRMNSLKEDLQYKDDELMTLLQSSIQSSDLSQGKVTKLEEQLAEKAAALQAAQKTSASYLKRQVEYDNKESELVQLQETHARQMLELESSLKTYQAETAQLTGRIAHMQDNNAKAIHKIEELEEHLRLERGKHAVHLKDFQNKEGEFVITRKDLLKAKAKISELEATVRNLRAANMIIPHDRSPVFGQTARSPFTAATPNGMNMSDIIPSATPAHASMTQSTSPLSSTISLLETQVMSLEKKCQETSSENAKLMEEYEASQRQLENITDELQRGRSSLEKQLKSRAESESELAGKVCDLNAQLEQLMQYSMKLTGELAKSKEQEAYLEKQLKQMSSELAHLRSQIMNDENPRREQELLHRVEEKEGVIEEWKSKAAHLESEVEKALALLGKAKQSKIRRYNKYVSLQQDYQLVVAQAERVASENADMRARHKVFVKTVEAALIGGEGKMALAKYAKERGESPGGAAAAADQQTPANRSLLNLTQEFAHTHLDMDADLSDIEETEDESPTRLF